MTRALRAGHPALLGSLFALPLAPVIIKNIHIQWNDGSYTMMSWPVVSAVWSVSWALDYLSSLRCSRAVPGLLTTGLTLFFNSVESTCIIGSLDNWIRRFGSSLVLIAG